MSCLLLNTDGAPVSLLPLSTISWREAIRSLVLEKATVLVWHEDWIVRSPSWSTRVPAVMILKDYQKKKSQIRFSKQNIFLRDRYICQYCDKTLTEKTATLDHVLPVSHGGKTNWENCVCACGNCNTLKGNNHKITPKVKPAKPSYYQLAERRRALSWDLKHSSWADYI
jgi:5-methylcytosine-specific restriction endonuclease McrA